MRAFVGRRIVLEYETGLKMRGRVDGAAPETGPVLVLHLADVVFERPRELIEEYQTMTVCPNGVIGFGLEEGPSGRSLRRAPPVQVSKAEDGEDEGNAA